MDIKSSEIAKLVELRKGNRIDFYSKIQCTKSIQNTKTEEYPEPLELILINVSTFGLGTISDKSFEKGAVLMLELRLEEETYGKVAAKVMWTVKKGNMFRHGLELTNISDKLSGHLRRLDDHFDTTA
jgi:hypothetical protein